MMNSHYRVEYHLRGIPHAHFAPRSPHAHVAPACTCIQQREHRHLYTLWQFCWKCVTDCRFFSHGAAEYIFSYLLKAEQPDSKTMINIVTKLIKSRVA